jgi:flagellar basal body rod protein FlgC
MNSAMSIAVSGMSAAWSRMTATAADVVQLATGGPLPAAAQRTASSSGRVSSPLAGSQIAFANSVDPARAMVSESTAALAYKANLKTFEAADKMLKSTLDMIA